MKSYPISRSWSLSDSPRWCEGHGRELGGLCCSMGRLSPKPAAPQGCLGPLSAFRPLSSLPPSAPQGRLCSPPPTPGRSCLRCRTQESVLVPASLASSDSSFVAVRYSRLKGLRCWFFHSFATVGGDFLFVTGRKRPAVLTELYCVLSSSSTVSAGRTPSRGERVFVSSVEIKWCQTTQFLP